MIAAGRPIAIICVLVSLPVAAAEPSAVLKHEGWVAAVAFSPDGKTLASAGADQVVRLWEVGTWKAKNVLQGHKDYVTAIAFSPTVQKLVSGSFDGTAIVWNLAEDNKATVSRNHHHGGVLAVAYQPGGGTNFATGGVDGCVMIGYHPSSPLLRPPVPRWHRSWVNSIVYNHDGSLLASGSSDGTVRLWGSPEAELQGGAGEVRAVAFSPDGKLLAAGNRYGTVRVWNVATREEVKTLAGHASDVWSIAFSPDGKTLAAADTDWKKPSRVRLWDTKTWKERGSLDVPGEILAIAYSPQGDWLAVGSWDKTVRLFPLPR